MRPLDVLAALPSPITELLRQAPPAEVEAELSRLDALPLAGLEAAARVHARGALALRVGRLADAREAFTEAADAFEAIDDPEASALSTCEGWLAAIRQGPRAVYDEAAEALEGLSGASSRIVRVVATHYRATALRFAGQAEGTLTVLLDAFQQSDGLLVERAQVLNSLGTLYVVLGAYGAAGAVLAHAAELNHQIGDRVSEAISYGQLGSAALGRGALHEARRFLQKQEWFASQVGDAFGRARALVMLADVALNLGRPDDTIELASQAIEIAESVSPPLTIWRAYGARTIGRAKIELGDESASEALEEARRRFAAIGNQLGDAFVAWDLARLDASGASERWHGPAWALASLGLTARVAQILSDVREALPPSAPRGSSAAPSSLRGSSAAPSSLRDSSAAPSSLRGSRDRQSLDAAIAAVGQIFPHLAAAQDVSLVLSEPDTIALVATRRVGGQRNLGRLAAHLLGKTGLYLAVVAASAIGTGIRPVPSRRSEGTLVGQLPGAAVIAWASDINMALVARDLSSLRVSLGDDTRAVVGLFPEARIVSLPFAGELGVEVSGADLGPHVASALKATRATLSVLPSTPWTGEAEALARLSGFNLW